MINEYFTLESPNSQSTLDCLGAKWISKVPLKNVNSGHIPLFEDGRMDWLTKRIDVSGKQVLELGSFEGGHTFMLANAGASVTGVESNSLSFIKSLLGKELLQYQAQFLYGDILRYLETCNFYDIIVASGVLYHMENPVEMLCRVAKKTNRVFIWTHYFDSNFRNWNSEVVDRLADKFLDAGERAEFGDFSYPVITQKYLESLDLREFCGGPTEKSAWMFREDILDLLTHLNFKNIEIVMEKVDHKHGPSFAIYAEKS